MELGEKMRENWGGGCGTGKMTNTKALLGFVCECVCIGGKGKVLPTATTPIPLSTSVPCHHLDFNANEDAACSSTHKAKVNTEMKRADTVTHAQAEREL